MHNDGNFDAYEVHQNWSKILFMDILRVFEDSQMRHQNLPQAVSIFDAC